MKKKLIIASLSTTIALASVYVLHQHPNRLSKDLVKESETTTRVQTKTLKQYEQIANAIKAEQEPVIVGQVFENGYLKKHGNHYHFVQGKPPQHAIYEEIHHELEDDYAFDSKDIVEENALGYVVKHGDHFHFIYKKNMTHAQQVAHTALTSSPNHTSMSVLEQHIAKIMKKYGVKRENIMVNEQDKSIIYPHGNHYHYEKIGEDLVEHHDEHETNHVEPTKTNSIHDTHSIQTLSPLEKQIAEIMRIYQLRRDQITIDLVNQALIYPHGNHYHYEKIGEQPKEHLHEEDNDIHVPKVDSHQDDDITNAIKPLNPLEKRIAELMKQYHLKREQIKVDEANNALVYPHGDHYHYEKIDQTKPITNHQHHHHIGEEYDDGSVPNESQRIIGPLAVSKEQLLNKDDILKRYPQIKVNDINHYHIVGFLAYPNLREKVGDLRLNEQLSDGVVYLVLKNIPWQEANLSIKQPDVKPKEEYYFKGWTHDVPKEDLVDRPRVFGAQFRLEKYKNTPKVLGPSMTKIVPGTDQVDMQDYVSVDFHALYNGSLSMNGTPAKHIFYLVKQGTTWSEALANGLSLPQTQADELYEFSGFSTDIAKRANEKVTTEIIWAKFGINLPVIGPYVPENVNQPIAEMDKKRPHPNDATLSYDKDKYVSVAFVAGENGKLESTFYEASALTYLIRKGTIWKDIKADLPNVMSEAGYVAKLSTPLPSDETAVNDNQIYRIQFEKVANAKGSSEQVTDLTSHELSHTLARMDTVDDNHSLLKKANNQRKIALARNELGISQALNQHFSDELTDMSKELVSFRNHIGGDQSNAMHNDMKAPQKSNQANDLAIAINHIGVKHNINHHIAYETPQELSSPKEIAYSCNHVGALDEAKQSNETLACHDTKASQELKQVDTLAIAINRTRVAQSSHDHVAGEESQGLTSPREIAYSRNYVGALDEEVDQYELNIACNYIKAPRKLKQVNSSAIATNRTSPVENSIHDSVSEQKINQDQSAPRKIAYSCNDLAAPQEETISNENEVVLNATQTGEDYHHVAQETSQE